MAERTITIIVETVWQSWGRDAGSLALAMGLIVPGWFMQSSAMQWLGLIVFFTLLLARGVAEKVGVFRCRSFKEARAKLDELERAQK